MNKIGVGICTCNRLNYLKNLIDTLIPCKSYINELVVINDGEEIPEWKLPFGTWINNKKNSGVAFSKNKALKFLLEKNCDYFFLIEDDMLIKNPTVFEKYVEASKVSGIQHFNYGPGSPFNRKQTIQNFDLHNRHLLDEKSEPNPKFIIDYKTCKIALYEHTVAMFSFFTKKILEKGLGFMPEEYDKCWEHVDSTYQIIKAGYHPPFWAFADLENSHLLVEEAPGAIQNSSIAKNKEEWMQRVMAGREIYKKKHGHYPNQVASPSKKEILESLKRIKINYGNLQSV
jgi:glycosyltransferase involved in cell wall biosynthesis